ncbi:ABC transporter ATP-binding protein [Streptomyces sp. NPDC047081]|uniref:ABC transporter ATP-binding protein n=1 Tax=Streptomyces sp. NPDC047081 TaxID=3154706 RepID=UPI0033F2A0A6
MIDAYEDPGTPDRRGGWHYLWWLVRRQLGRCTAGALLASVWMVLMAAAPYLMSRAIDDGLVPGHLGTLAWWTVVLFAVGAVNAWLSIMRHRTMTRVRLDANLRTVKVVVGHAVRLGAALSRRAGAGEVVTIGVGDVQTISQALTVVGPGAGAVVVYAFVAGLLLDISTQLAAVVLLGIPVIVLCAGPLTVRLQSAESEYRQRQGILTARIGDLAGGLRVLNGLGGKGLFADAFRQDSQRLRRQGYRVGAVASWMQALGVGLPTLFLAVVTWLAARLTAQGTISIGELVAVYGYASVLVGPVAFFIQMTYDLNRGVVAARRVVRLLHLEPEPDEGTTPAPAEPSTLHDPTSDVRVLPGRLTALVSARPGEAAEVIDRLGRYTPSTATWGGTRLDAIPLAELRARILVADNEAALFAGPLHEVIGASGAPQWGAGLYLFAAPPRGATSHNAPAHATQQPEATPLAQSIHAAAAEDIVQALPDGIHSPIDAEARNLSGGQRQRIRLARALLTDPEVLLAVEPTSALDAHTEATVAQRLRIAREGRTTLVATTSPLVLDRVDTVLYLVDGKLAAAGPHRRLLADQPGYRALVARDADEEVVR